MADFRRVVTALAVVVLLMGLASTASAQPTVPALACTASAAVPPLLRAEGLTELVGDVVLNCSGGVPVAAGTSIPTANFTVFLGNTTVTSRILDTGNNASEAVLLVDEPHTNLPGAPADYVVSSNPQQGCPVISVTVGSTTTNVLCPAGDAGIPNVYRGIVSGNSVTFIGVPINPPGTTATRIFRITNVRANASTVGAGPAGTPGQVQAFISISGSTSIPINNPTQVVGFVQNGLTFSVRNNALDALSSSGLSFSQCNDITARNTAAVLRFTENFATAFKVRVNTSDGSATGTPVQNVPGQVYNTESGLIVANTAGTNLITGTGLTTLVGGLADFGTRLRATFNNVPAGVSVYVPLVNFISSTSAPANASVRAVLVGSETGARFEVSATATNFRDINVTTGGANSVAQVPIVNGTGTAVWEVMAASSLLSESLDFPVYFGATANVGSNSPASGVQGTVSGSFAPAPPAFDASAGARASATLPIPRFIDTGSARNLIVINICRTNLLFPFVTNQAGFDTGLAIANTSKDPFGTTAQSGTCTLNFYGDNAPSAVTTAAVAGGTVTTALASASAPNFQGYVIAVCNFQFGHGFAFVSDLGARNLAMGYLALVIPDPARKALGLSLASGNAGELLGQ